MKKSTRRLLPLSIAVLLSACAGLPSQLPPVAKRAAAPASARPLPVPTAAPGMPAPAAGATTSPMATNVWDRLRGSFAMSDCDSDPTVMKWATRYTHNPRQFEENIRQALPRMVYVQQVAAQYHVPGEFVLLPWVESHYRSVPPRQRRPAGMWQLSPATARAAGLRTDRQYDGRLDLPVATQAVMKLLAQYHDKFNDWRVADYAYNAGEFRLRGLIREHGAPAEQPVIPDLPVGSVTREHLVKLLAIACVVREPERFQVALPTLPEAERLVQTPVARPMTIERAAQLSGMSVAALRHVNPASHDGRVGAGPHPHLMLPAGRADRFRAAVDADGRDASGSPSTTTVASSGKRRHASAAHARRTHVVTSGESLWQIAREYATTVARLQALNDLAAEQAIQPGQVLELDPID